MKICVHCPKGHAIRCDRSRIGKIVRCPHPDCGVTFEVQVDWLPVEQKSCPECDRPLEPESVICIHCGFNLKTGSSSRMDYQPDNYESKVELPPEDPRKNEYRSLEIQVRFILVILFVLFSFGMALFNPSIYFIRQIRLRWLFQLLGWQTTWIIMGSLWLIILLAAVGQYLRKGHNDMLEGVDDDLQTD